MTQMQTEPRDTILRERDFIPLLDEAAARLGRIVAQSVQDPSLLSESGPVAYLTEAADSLEGFLDDHGARENRSFVTFGEMVASIRGLAKVRGLGLYLLSRMPRYQTLGDNVLLTNDLKAADESFGVAIDTLCGGLLEEAGKLGFDWGAAPLDVDGAPLAQRLLPRNLDADVSVDEGQHIVEIGGKYMTVLKASRQLGLSSRRATEKLPAFVADHATEDRCRWYESAVHNIQSMYDTYVLRTAFEEDHAWLRSLRGHTSIAKHLLEMATGLVHFYERHENDLRHEAARERIAGLVSKTAILDVAVNVCLRQAYLYVEEASVVAERVIATFGRQQTTELIMPQDVSLHARPLALIVQIARHYRSPLEITIEGDKCSALSLMGLIMLAGQHPKPEMLTAEGDPRALADLQTLFLAGLGESGESGELPAGLSYLRTRS
jgi:phosphotransferase system HPr (HPr) family protein